LITIPGGGAGPSGGRPAARQVPLRGVAALFTVAVLVHNVDHLRRGVDAVAGDVFVAGTLAIVVEVGVVWLVVAGHRLATLACVATGFSLAAGYLLVHFTPSRGWLSDSLADGDVDWFSWVAASGETVAAAALGVVGVVAIRGMGGLGASVDGRATDGRRLVRALAHPVVAVAALGNLAVLVVSLATW
jgi:hypothetical protein